MIAINAIAALIMLFALIPTAKLVRNMINGLLDAFFGGDPAEEAEGAGKNALRNASFIAMAGMKNMGSSGGNKGSEGGKAPDTGRADGTNGNKNISSDGSDKGHGGYLPEKRATTANERNGTTGQRTTNREGSSIVDKHGQPISSGMSTGGNEQAGASTATGATAHNANATHQSGAGANSNINRSTSRQSQNKPTARSQTKKWANVGGKVGGAIGKVPSTMAGMGMAIPFGPVAGHLVNKGGTALSQMTGKAIGGTAGLAAYGGSKAVQATGGGIRHIRSSRQRGAASNVGAKQMTGARTGGTSSSPGVKSPSTGQRATPKGNMPTQQKPMVRPKSSGQFRSNGRYSHFNRE
ncbi:hypothetical protein [Lentibacillus salinarum]|uniref:Uncharacterized protein n=1 Tax=Lentibacillus salinarum TaxID=446820 RepID=A0ABW3ZXZ6_9BACI